MTAPHDAAATSGAPCFLADAMLGRLARWLRVLGVDTALAMHEHDDTLVARCAVEGRWLLTRDRPLAARAVRPGALLVEHDAPMAQLRQVMERFALPWPAPLFTRCTVCNTPLREVDPADAATKLPPAARAPGGVVRCCPGCGRTYWEGSHARRMRAALERALGA